MTASLSDRHAVERELPRDQRQAMLVDWARMAFGDVEATSVPQRSLRLLEEAIEAFQACGCDEAMAHKLVSFVFVRPPGTVGQELGGVAVTVLLLAAAAGVSADDEEAREVHRVLSKPLREFSERNANKNAAGFKIASSGFAERSPSAEGVEPGQRHTMLKAMAGAMRFRGAGYDEIEPALLAANKMRCNPPKADAEVRAIARWAAEQPASSSFYVGNPCCGNVGTHGEGGREFCSTCGQEIVK